MPIRPHTVDARWGSDAGRVSWERKPGVPDLAQTAAEDAQAQLAASQAAAADGESRMLALEANLARHKGVCAVRPP